jgi:hypothetical protein
LRPLKNVNFCLSSRKAKILTTGIHGVFLGLKFESDPREIGFAPMKQVKGFIGQAFHRAGTEIG